MLTLTGFSYNQHKGTYVASTTSPPFTAVISADQAREIIGRAFSDSTIATIMQWDDDQVISLSLTELMELEEAMEVITDEMDYQETIADFLAGTR